MPIRKNDLQYPILGQKTRDQILRDIYNSIVDEASAAEFYTRLLKEAPNELHRDFIENARDEELKHLKFFSDLYQSFTGKRPQYDIKPTKYSSYKEGIEIALRDELEAADFYRNMQLSVVNNIIRDTFYLAMVDELEHATQFSTLYNTL